MNLYRKYAFTNYRWYIAMLWLVILLPYMLIQYTILGIGLFFVWFGMRLTDIWYACDSFNGKYLSWAAKWFFNSLPEHIKNPPAQMPPQFSNTDQI